MNKLEPVNMTFNFDIHKGSVTFGIPYDIKSIMHYESIAFTKNGNATILQKVSLRKNI